MSRLAWPEGLERSVLACAGLAWAGVAATRSVAFDEAAAVPALTLLAVAVAVAAMRLLPPALLVGVVVAASVAGSASASREMMTLRGLMLGSEVGNVVTVSRDAVDGRWGGAQAMAGSSDLPPIVLRLSDDRPRAGERWRIDGEVVGGPGRWRGIAYAGVIDVHEAELVEAGSLLIRQANGARDRVAAVFDGLGSAGGLVAGFMIGDTTNVAVADLNALRAAGLSHYVAVSGSNVALFLGLWWVATAALGTSPRRRAVVGAVGLVFFVWITRWEPSVVRAAVMAALVLGSRAIGVPVTGWAALGGAVVGVVLISSELVGSLGFQLSAAATAGVLLCHRLIRVPYVGPLLSATIGAQVAVAPLLLSAFGSVPLLAPVSNLLAAPLVSASTGLGVMASVTGWPILASGASAIAQAVIAIGRLAAPLPQVDVWAVIAIVLLAAGWRFAATRVASVGVALIAAVVILLAPPPVASGVVFLDVGQGDAILLLGEQGGTVLIDGGPDPDLLLDRLRHYEVDRVDLVVNTHPHEDHIAGLIHVMASVPVGVLWHSGYESEQATRLLSSADDAGVPPLVPDVGTQWSVGGIHLEVRGPRRRYASPNDQSVVLVATVNGVRVGLPGDIETFAQRDLGPITADVLKVPHQGADTSDHKWLAANTGCLAVVSVGPNQFGHPHDGVIETLELAGAEVRRTDVVGDVIVSSPSDVPAC